MKLWIGYLIVTGLLVMGLAMSAKAQQPGQSGKAAKSLPETEKPKPPREVSLTEVQRLKLENAQLRLRDLDRQVKELQKQIGDDLTAAMKLAGVPETEMGNYGFDDRGRLVYVEPKVATQPTGK